MSVGKDVSAVLFVAVQSSDDGKMKLRIWDGERIYSPRLLFDPK